MKKLFCTAFLFMATAAFAVQYQATSAALSGGATISGNYVQMNAGNISWTVNVSSAGMYDITVHYKQDYDASKEQNLEIGGAKVGSIVFPRTTSWKDATIVARLNSGNNTVAITNSWGYVDIMYIDITPHENTPFNLDKNLVNTNANTAAKNVFAFMQDKFQKKVISGVMTGNINGVSVLNNQEEVQHIRNSSGNKTPALVGFDFMHGTGMKSDESWFKTYTSGTITLAIDLWNRGGIPTFCWHWKDPLKGAEAFYAPGKGNPSTNFDFTTACTNSSCASWNENSAAYKAMVADIDAVAGYLKQLQDAGVAVLWRPIHEASGEWFWWGAKGPAAFKRLYELIYSRLTTTHSLKNLIWVWNSEGADKDWYPGENRVDIIGRDFYYYPEPTSNTPTLHASLIGEFEKLKNLFGTKKMIALAENGNVPYPDNLIADGAGWSYFMPWYGKHTKEFNSASEWNSIMNHSYVITLEDMPGWSTYTPPSSSSGTPSSSSTTSSSSVASSSSTTSSSSVASSSSSTTISSSSSSSTSLSSSSSSNSVSPIRMLSSTPSTAFNVKAMSNGALLVESHANAAIYLYDSKGNMAQSIHVPAGSSVVKTYVPAGVYVIKNAANRQTQVVVVK